MNLQNVNRSLHDTPNPCYTFTLIIYYGNRILFGKETIDLARRSQSAGEQPHRSRNRSDTASTRCNSVFGHLGRRRHIVSPTKRGVLAYRFACHSRIVVDLNFSGRVRAGNDGADLDQGCRLELRMRRTCLHGVLLRRRYAQCLWL